MRSPTPLRLAASLLALAIATPAMAQEAANLVVGGDFELEGVSLRLPEVSPFPLIVGGWGSRTDAPAAALPSFAARSGAAALEISSTANASAYAIQDVPQSTPGFVFGIAVQRERGRQSIALLGDWDRMDPGADALLRLDLRSGAIRVRTPAGSWDFDASLADGRWHDIQVRVDPRTEVAVLRLDDQSLGAFPTGTIEAPRTLILGGNARGEAVYRYDEVRLHRLPEIELSALIERVRAAGNGAAERRLEAARTALAAGAPRMMAAELRAARRLIEGASDAASAAATADLLDLLEASQ